MIRDIFSMRLVVLECTFFPDLTVPVIGNGITISPAVTKVQMGHDLPVAIIGGVFAFILSIEGELLLPYLAFFIAGYFFFDFFLGR
jgi:hypothetical protein